MNKYGGNLVLFLLAFPFLSCAEEIFHYDFAVVQSGHVETMQVQRGEREFAGYIFISMRAPYTAPRLKFSRIYVPQPAGMPWFRVEYPTEPGLYQMAAGACSTNRPTLTNDCTNFESTINAVPRGLLFWVE